MFPPFLLRYFSTITTSFNYRKFFIYLDSLLNITLFIMYSHLQVLSLFCNILPETHEYKSRFIFFLEFVLFKNAINVFPKIFKLILCFSNYSMIFSCLGDVMGGLDLHQKNQIQIFKMVFPIR